MAYLNNTGLSIQINTIKAYISNQINSATNSIESFVESYTTNRLTNYLSLAGGNITGNLTVKNVSVLPPGIIQAYSGSTVPTGWLLCDGSAISRITYADLFDIIGITYGSGDGSTTFNLPNLIDKFIQGSNTAGTVKAAGLPNITGTQFLGCQDTSAGTLIFGASSGTGALSNPTYTAITNQKYLGPSANNAASSHRNTLNFNASNSNSIYGNSSTVQPPALTLKFIIKY